MSRRLVVVGDAMLDRTLDGVAARLCPEGPVPVIENPVERVLPGGAALAAALAAGDGAAVTLVSALGRDAAGAELARLLTGLEIELIDTGLASGLTHEKVRVRAGGRLVARLDRGGGVPSPPNRSALGAVRGAACVLVEDYGRGIADDPALRDALARVPLVVWDPHPRGAEPPAGLILATPNAAEATVLTGLRPAAAASALRARWRASAVAVTCGAEGAVVDAEGSPTVTVPAVGVPGADACGAGDRLAVSAALALAAGAGALEAVGVAVDAASGFVAAGGIAAGVLPSACVGPGETGIATARAVQARGGRVVATGGCFDLLHTGHARLLEAARRLGDHLVVCLNSDASVSRLKGPDRPLVPQDDRAALLRALAAVDDVVVFDEETPAAVLELLRPDVWVKGADYAVAELPEARVVERWGGRVVLVPYVAGRSTTRLLERAVGRVA